MLNQQIELSEVIVTPDDITIDIKLYGVPSGHFLFITMTCSCGVQHSPPVSYTIPHCSQEVLDDFMSEIISGIGLIASAGGTQH